MIYQSGCNVGKRDEALIRWFCSTLGRYIPGRSGGGHVLAEIGKWPVPKLSSIF